MERKDFLKNTVGFLVISTLTPALHACKEKAEPQLIRLPERKRRVV